MTHDDFEPAPVDDPREIAAADDRERARRLALLSDLVDVAFTALDDAAELAGELDLIRTRDHLRRALGMAGAASTVVELVTNTDAAAVPAAAPLCASPGCGHLPTSHVRALAGARAYCDVVRCPCLHFVAGEPDNDAATAERQARGEAAAALDG